MSDIDVEEVVKDGIDEIDCDRDGIIDGLKYAVDLGCLSYSSGMLPTGGSISDGADEFAELLQEWHFDKFSSYAIGHAVYMAVKHSLTASEMKCIGYVVDRGHFEPEDIERRQSPDFVVDGNVGVEVKSNENYSLSRRQLQAMDEYSPFHIYLCTRTRVELLDVVNWIGMNEYQDME